MCAETVINLVDAYAACRANLAVVAGLLAAHRAVYSLQMNDEGDDQDRNLSDLVEILARVMSHAANEPTLIKRMEPHLSPRPANIYTDEADAEDLERHICKFLNKIEPQQKLIITRDDEPLSLRDRIRTYQFDISEELTDCFRVCRNAVCRLHMFYITHESVRVNREFWKNMSEEDAMICGDLLAKSFWEALEIATVRLVSYWDRVGQLLDFIFSTSGSTSAMDSPP